MVEINYNSYILRQITKKEKEVVFLHNSIKILKLIKILSKKYGKEFNDILVDDNKKIKLPILINGIKVENLNYIIKNNDRINIISLISGG